MPDDVNLSDLEQRLSGWRPDTGGLNADALLFAAGRASIRPNRTWPAIAASLGVIAVLLGSRLSSERTERLELQARQNPAPRSSPPIESPPLTLPESSYLAALRSLERDSDAWLARAIPEGQSSPPGPVFRAGERGGVFDQ